MDISANNKSSMLLAGCPHNFPQSPVSRCSGIGRRASLVTDGTFRSPSQVKGHGTGSPLLRKRLPVYGGVELDVVIQT